MFDFDIEKHSFNHVHFIGIGGISMSGIAQVLKQKNYIVSGSDRNESQMTKKLASLGIDIKIGHDANNLKGVDLVVYTSAVNDSNVELQTAKERNLICVDRATFLGQLMKKYERSIAVSGTHGKTTTTGMMATVLALSEHDSTVLLGGNLDLIDGNVHLGHDDIFLTEACEYKENFLKFFPFCEVILNIDEDHLDYYKDIKHITSTFDKFVDIIPSNGFVVLNNDDINCQSLNTKDKSIVTFGIENNSNYMAKEIVFDNFGRPTYKLYVDNSFVCDVTLSVLGVHNVLNSLSVIACFDKLGISPEFVSKKLKEFKGTHRRFEFKGDKNGFLIIDDYAHHPTEIKASLSSIKNMQHKKVFCIFQPHTFSRTISLLNEFSTSFEGVDHLIIADIYPSREVDTGIVHSKDLVDKIIEHGQEALYMSSFKEIEEYILQNAKSGDLILTMGAGDVFKIGDSLLK